MTAAVPNRAIAVTSLKAYAEPALYPGDTLHVRINAPNEYSLSVVRLGWDVESSDQDWEIHSVAPTAAQLQPIHPGSYVHVEEALEGASTALTLECWVRRFEHDYGGTIAGRSWQGVITQYRYPDQCGCGLFLAPVGEGLNAAMYFGDGSSFDSSCLTFGATALAPNTWHHLVAVFDDGDAYLYVNGTLDASLSDLPTLDPGPAPLRIGAYGDSSGTSNFLEGDIAMPAIYSVALTSTEVALRAGTTPPVAPSTTNLLGCWPLEEEIGSELEDIGPASRDGSIINRGTWMIGGPGFDSFGVTEPYDPTSDETRGHGLRLSSRDLYDCEWSVSQTYTLPDDLLPGIYVARIQDGHWPTCNVSFVVRRPGELPAARIGVLCATNTWRAYAIPWDEPGSSFGLYVPHVAGQPTYQVGSQLPWPQADPYALENPVTSSTYGHLVKAERHLHIWLERNGYDYDVITDYDLHENPSLLQEFDVAFIPGHSEYWSVEAYGGVGSYLDNGGKLIVASGNTMFWRVTYSGDGNVMECRKFPNSIANLNTALGLGEIYHEFDQLRGGLMRKSDSAAWQLTGIDCVGWHDAPGPWKVRDDEHDVFHVPEAISLENGDDIGTPDAVRHEYDARLQRIPGAPSIPSGYEPHVIADRTISAAGSTGLYVSYDGSLGTASNVVVSEMTEWTREYGTVFSFGAINTAASLHSDPNMSTLLRNLLHRYGRVVKLGVVAVRNDGTLIHRHFDGSAWQPTSTWDEIGTGYAGTPVGLQWSPDYMSILGVSTSDEMLYNYGDGATWASENKGGSLIGRPVAVSWGRNRIAILAHGTDDNLYSLIWDGSSWSSWVSIGASVSSDAAAIVSGANEIIVATLDTAGHVQYKILVGGAWSPSSGWSSLDTLASFVTAPVLIRSPSATVSLFVTTSGGAVKRKVWDGATWSSWEDLGGSITRRVAVVMLDDDEIHVLGTDSSGDLWEKVGNGSTWGSWTNIGSDFMCEPSATVIRGRTISLIAVNASTQHIEENRWNGAWSGWTDLGGESIDSAFVYRWLD
jgi:hypothetical protein